MKKLSILLVVITFCLFQSCNNTASKEAGETDISAGSPAISFETLEHDFGKIAFKGDASYDFIFENTGDQPLILENVKPTCGCTASDWTKSPVGHGEKGKISVKYRTSVPGSFTKSIMVYTNASDPIKLIIKGTVEEAAAAEG